MRDYGKVHGKFWINPDIHGLSDDAKLLALYLLTGPHSNMIGCMRLPINYVADDLNWGSERVSKGFKELSEAAFLAYDDRFRWVWVKSFLRFNSIENPNQGKSAMKLIEEIPRTVHFYRLFLEQTANHAEKIEGFKAFQELAFSKLAEDEVFFKPSGTVSKPFRNQDTEQDTEQEKHGYNPPYPPFADSAAMPTEDTASGLPELGRTSSRSAARTKGAHSDRDRSSRTAPARETGKDTGPSPVILPDFLPEAEWLAFVEHRKALKAPLTPIAETRALAVLGKFYESGMNPSEVINQSIVNGWKGLFPLKTTTTTTTGGSHGNTFADWNRSEW